VQLLAGRLDRHLVEGCTALTRSDGLEHGRKRQRVDVRLEAAVYGDVVAGAAVPLEDPARGLADVAGDRIRAGLFQVAAGPDGLRARVRLTGGRAEVRCATLGRARGSLVECAVTVREAAGKDGGRGRELDAEDGRRVPLSAAEAPRAADADLVVDDDPTVVVGRGVEPALDVDAHARVGRAVPHGVSQDGYHRARTGGTEVAARAAPGYLLELRVQPGRVAESRLVALAAAVEAAVHRALAPGLKDRMERHGRVQGVGRQVDVEGERHRVDGGARRNRAGYIEAE
jgi:hypothetical protein